MAQAVSDQASLLSQVVAQSLSTFSTTMASPAAVTTGGQAMKPLVGGRAGMEEATQAQEQQEQGAELKVLVMGRKWGQILNSIQFIWK